MALIDTASENIAYRKPDEKPVKEDVLTNLRKMACIAASVATAPGNAHNLPRFLALQVSGLFDHASDKKSKPMMNLPKAIQAIGEHFPREAIPFQPSFSAEADLKDMGSVSLWEMLFLLSQFVFLLWKSPCHDHAMIILERLRIYLGFSWHYLELATSGQGSSRDIKDFLSIIAMLHLICRCMKGTWTNLLCNTVKYATEEVFHPSGLAHPHYEIMRTAAVSVFACMEVLWDGELDFLLDYLSHLMNQFATAICENFAAALLHWLYNLILLCRLEYSGFEETSDCQQTSPGPTASGDVASALKREFSDLNRRRATQAVPKTSKMHGKLLNRFENFLDRHRSISRDISRDSDFTFSCIHTVELMRQHYMTSETLL